MIQQHTRGVVTARQLRVLENFQGISVFASLNQRFHVREMVSFVCSLSGSNIAKEHSLFLTKDFLCFTEVIY